MTNTMDHWDRMFFYQDKYDRMLFWLDSVYFNAGEHRNYVICADWFEHQDNLVWC